MVRNRIIIYEDNHKLREYIKNILMEQKEDYEVIGNYPDCSDVREQIKRLNPDIVLMDINMPNVDGLEGLYLIKKHFPGVKVLMLTEFSDEEKIIKAIQLKCDGYMLKEELPFGLEKAIKLVIKGEAHLTPSVAKRLMETIYKTGGFSIPFTKSKYKLTPAEKVVLSKLAKAYSYKEIAKELNVTENTIGSHVKHIYDKLQVNSKAAAVRKAIEERLVDLD